MSVVSVVFILLLSKALKVDCLWSDGDDVLSADFVKSLPGEVKFVEITRSSVKGSEAWITLRCPVHQHSIATFTVSFIARSSPCGREYLETLRDVRNRKDTLSRYYCYPQFTQSVFDYTHIWALTPKISYTVNCADHGTRVFKQFLPSDWLKMEVDKNLTGDADCVDSMEKQSKRKIAFVTPIDAIYLLVFRVENINGEAGQVQMDIKWSDPHFGFYGSLNAIKWPLLPFFGCLSGIYVILAILWLGVSLVHRRHLLQIHFWIGGVVFICILEAVLSVSEYGMLNSDGPKLDHNLVIIVSCLKGTAARMLLLAVSMGVGVVKLRLGTTLCKIVGVGFVHFVCFSLSEIMTMSVPQRSYVLFLQLILETGIWFWVFHSLLNINKAVQMSKNNAKVLIYRAFTCTLIMAVVAIFVFVSWTLFSQVFNPCVQNWKTLWIDEAFWHMLWATILLVIMILWRPHDIDDYRTLIDDTNASNEVDLGKCGDHAHNQEQEQICIQGKFEPCLAEEEEELPVVQKIFES